MRYTIIVATLLTSMPAWTQTIDNSTISIEGEFEHKQVITKADKLKILRRKLEKQNELLVRRQIEKMRYQQELEMTRKIQQAFDQNMKSLEKIN